MFQIFQGLSYWSDFKKNEFNLTYLIYFFDTKVYKYELKPVFYGYVLQLTYVDGTKQLRNTKLKCVKQFGNVNKFPINPYMAHVEKKWIRV